MPLTPSATLPCPDLAADLVRFDHPSGLTHWHLTTAFPQQVFALGVPTAVEEATGVPHILEHLALCGSENFPVRGVFSKMQSRSVASFMNAMTSPVHTMYVFSTPHEQDFSHLSQVYLDAVFRPLLTEADFRQEGWRWTLDGDGQPILGGVVYNEMKGAFQNPDRAKGRAMLATLAPDTALAHDSGGDPSVIPTLTHERLRQFHHELYDPRRSVLVTAGPVDLDALHTLLDSWVPQRGNAPVRPVTPITFAPGPAREATHPGDAATASLSHLWVLPDASFDEEAMSEWMSLALFLLPGSPLEQALAERQANLAQGTGYSDGTSYSAPRQGVLQLAIQGHDDVLSTVVPELVAQWSAGWEAATDVLQSALDQMRDDLVTMPEKDPRKTVINLLQRALSGRLESQAGLAWIERMQARLDAGDAPAMLAEWVQRWQASPTTRLLHVPDAQFHQPHALAEQARIEAYRAQVTPEQMAAMAEYEATQQQRHDNVEVLPQLDASALTPPLRPAAPREWTAPGVAGAGVAHVACGASKGQITVRWDVSGLDMAAWTLLARWAMVGMELGTPARSWSEQTLQEQADGHRLSIELAFMPRPLAAGVVGAFDLTLDGPVDRVETMAERMLDRLSPVRTDEVERFQQLLREHQAAQASERAEELMSTAMATAGGAFSQAQALADELYGLRATEHLEAWTQACLDVPQMAAMELRALGRAFEALRTCPKVVSCVGNAAVQAQAVQVAAQLSGPFVQTPADWGNCAVATRPTGGLVRLEGPLQVHHCVTAWAMPLPGTAADGHANVAAAVLRERLHTKVREAGGAYGVHVVTNGGAMVAASYRDPRLDGTLRDLQETLEGLVQQPPSADELLRAKTGLAQEWWRPQSDKVFAQRGLVQWMMNMTDADRMDWRQRVSATTSEDVVAVAQFALRQPSQQAAAVPMAPRRPKPGPR